MAVKDSGSVTWELRGRVGVITLDRPGSLNALSGAMLRELLGLLGDAAGRDGAAVLVLTGAGRAFSAGVDLYELEAARAAGESEAEARRRLERLQDVTRRIVDGPVPVVAALNGPAVGLGAEIAAACDVRIMARGATISFPEARRGLSATNGASYLLPRLVGSGRALDWLLTGREVEPEEARAAGFASAVVSEMDLRARALEVADIMASAAPGGVAAARRLLREPVREALEEALRREVEVVLEGMRSPEYEAGLRGFVERRGPEAAPRGQDRGGRRPASD